MNEEIRISRKQYIGLYLWAVVLCWTVIVPLILIAYIEIKVRSTKYIVGDKEACYEYKFLSTNKKKVNKTDITDVSISQTFGQRLCKIGNVNINTAGSHTIEMRFVGVKNFEDIMKRLK